MLITVGQILFPSKVALRLHVKEILHRSRPHPWLDGEDLVFLTTLLREHHPAAERKVGPGVKGIWVGPNEYGQPTFFLQRVDGTTTDFSYLKCISPPTERLDFERACRCAVDPQTYAFKLAAFAAGPQLVCPVLRISIVISEAHVDHAPPITFKNLISHFCDQEHIRWTGSGKRDWWASKWASKRHQSPVDASVVNGADGSMTYRLVDRALEARWIDFHQQHAELRVVSARANLSEIRRAHHADLAADQVAARAGR